MLAAAVDDLLAAEDQAALRGADQFVGRAGDGVDAAARSARGSSAAEVKPYGARSTTRPLPSSYSSGSRALRATATSSSIDGDSVKPTISKFERCTRRIAAEASEIGGVVVGGARAVRRPDFAQPRAALLDDVGNAERAADLDQLAARDDDFLPAGDGREQQQRAGGVVVRQDRRLASEQRPAELRQMLVAPSAAAFLEVEFEIRVAGGDAAARDQIAASIGERPRFVWMMMPVPLITRRSVDAVAAASALSNVIGRDVSSNGRRSRRSVSR